MYIDDYFQFRDNFDVRLPCAGFCATLPVGVESSEELIEVLKKILLFPAYCGSNWNAIDECMGDFSWIEQCQISLIHPVIPKVPALELKIYIEILYSRVESWRYDDDHKFIVIFNNKDRTIVESALFSHPNK
ncbi:barstar family protein [Achromobacter aloeverae]|uniref:Barstar (barnase inhibitor) domain-containing protein n=1 Tax=Achromobacter aloeverae TaxID=1750518 RepID=A0A4Q1HQY3_9BURK|nr:barstar family protein [Achromobacter aloeverae]RXN92826.1 hypothetical protein C7R54_03530 [Achromobacter aloeverae]